MGLAPADVSDAVRLTIVVPFHRNLDQLARCLAAIVRSSADLPAGAALAEVLVAADGAKEDASQIAAALGVRLLVMPQQRGPAAARTWAAAQATGNLLVFVDTDVVIHADALGRLAALFLAEPALGAAFGAYDDTPADAGFFSQCRNLAHSFIHQRSNREAETFWAGLGAVRTEVFASVGGFDPRFPRPSVEDIDLGYRIRQAGFRIVLDAGVRGTHLKRWTLWSSIVTDVRDRGVPWTQLLNRYKVAQNDLNLTYRYRVAVVLAYVAALCLVGAAWRPELIAGAVLAAAGLWVLDRPYYRFFIRQRGLGFTIAWFPFHVLHHLCNGVSFIVGTTLYLGRRWAGIALPWALPVTPWSPRGSR